VHWVPDAGVDTGPVIRTEVVPIVAGDTLDSLTDRVHAVEHRLLPLAVGDALRSLRSSDTPLEVPS
ncbi:MAG: phosphoribosylglycinamide formyltransferase, partial [Acidimicrobiia bacterium]|nr:phosphoribosylglycinamide formyltransferase [Acidimicrobiia bacterium]